MVPHPVRFAEKWGTTTLGADWPARQVCTQEGPVDWQSISFYLWEQVELGQQNIETAGDEVQFLISQNNILNAGETEPQACWLGKLGLRFWMLWRAYPHYPAHDFEAEWLILLRANWSLVLLSDFPIFGLLRLFQTLIHSCEHNRHYPLWSFFHNEAAAGRLSHACPLSGCDKHGQELSREQTKFWYRFNDVVIQVLGAQSLRNSSVPTLSMPPPSGEPSGCPLQDAYWDLSRAFIALSRDVTSVAWDTAVAMVQSAQHRVTKWLHAAAIEHDDLLQASRADNRSSISRPLDAISEVLASRWQVMGLLHALQLLLRRIDVHPSVPLPWLVAEGQVGLELLTSRPDERNTFLRYFLARLRTEFWGGNDGVDRFLMRQTVSQHTRTTARFADHGERAPNMSRSRDRVFVDVGALCHWSADECLLAMVLKRLGCYASGLISTKPRLYGFEPNRDNFRATQRRLARLPRRWRRCVTLQQAAVSDGSVDSAPLYGSGTAASLRKDAYVNMPRNGNEHGELESHAEVVSVVTIAAWTASTWPPIRYIEVLKVDVEGAEWQVLQGAEPLLTQQRVGTIVLEYSQHWGSGATLHSVAVYLSARGYDGYFLGSRRVIPFSGAKMEWWTDLYEVCANIHMRIYRGLADWCWFNVAFVLRRSRMSAIANRWVPWALVPA